MAQYDSISKEYAQVAHSSVHYQKVMVSSVWKLVGDVKGKMALDLACGNGKFSNGMKERGASKVIGVDISQGIMS